MTTVENAQFGQNTRPPLPDWVVWRSHGVWQPRLGRGSCLRRDCDGAGLLVNQLPSFTAIHASDFRDLAALKEHLQESLRPFNAFLDLRPIELDTLHRLV